jgi:large subunit ribosomal protein L24
MRTKSKKPGKQRKYEKQIPYNEKHKLVSANLSHALREAKGFRSLPVKVGDEVLITRGDFKGMKGKVSKVNHLKQYIVVEKVTRKKSDNSDVGAKIHPSNVIIMKLGKIKKDKFRVNFINRRVKEDSAKIDPELIEEEDEDIIDIDEDEYESSEALDEDFELTDEPEDITNLDSVESDDEEDETL